MVCVCWVCVFMVCVCVYGVCVGVCVCVCWVCVCVCVGIVCVFILYITTPLFIPAHGLGVDVMNIINIVVIIVVVVDIVEAERDNHGGFYRPVQTGSDWIKLDRTGSE
ncbi:unnamed protein product [Lota lota]